MPVDLVIDLGKETDLTGFKYLPGQGRTTGIITSYDFAVSPDNQQGNVVDTGEFANIKNNPLWQVKPFKPAKARYVRLRAIRNTQDDNAVGYAELDLITN
jgi:alpha-L-fucosidase